MRDTLLEKIVHWAVGAIASAAGGWIVTLHDPFYHPGWIADHAGWLLLPLVAVFAALALCLLKIGFWVVVVFALLGAAAFGVLYGDDAYQHGGWPLFAWVLHLIVLALLVGIVAGVASRLAFRVKR